MVDPNKPIIDTRTMVTGQQSSPVNSKSSNGVHAPEAQPSSANKSAPVPETTADGTPYTTAEVKTVSSAPISTTIPAQYTASSYAELIPELEKQMAAYKPLSEEQLKKIRRRQKAEGIMSGISDAVQSVSNLIFANQYAPNMYNARESMSARAKARFEKEKAEREASDEKYFQYAMTLGRMKDADKARRLEAWKTEQALARQDRAYDATRKDREDDVIFRNKDYDERLRQWQASFDRQGEWHDEESKRWEHQFNESIRQFNVSSANERTRLGMEAQRLAHAMKEGQMTFNLGSGNGNVTLSLDKLNAQTVSRIFSTLPTGVRDNVKGDPIYKPKLNEDGSPMYSIDGKQMMEFAGYGQPSTEAMLMAIGANVESSPNTQKAIREVAGIKTESMPGTGSKMPGVK